LQELVVEVVVQVLLVQIALHPVIQVELVELELM
tara:strand:- start:1119 stop:1220 length:102 start_codon:yes stop_codon:yes gene_type:complete